MKAACAVCGKEFEKRTSAKTCGDECRAEWNRKRGRERMRDWKAANPKKAKSQYERQKANRQANRESYNARQQGWRDRNRPKRDCIVCGTVIEAKRRKKTCGDNCAAERYKVVSREFSKSYRVANLEKCRESSRKRSRRLYAFDPGIRQKATECMQRHRAKYREKCRESNRIYARLWRANNRDRYIAYRRSLNAAHRLGLHPLHYAVMKLSDRFNFTPTPE